MLKLLYRSQTWIAAELPVKFPRDRITYNPYIAALRFREIWSAFFRLVNWDPGVGTDIFMGSVYMHIWIDW